MKQKKVLSLAALLMLGGLVGCKTTASSSAQASSPSVSSSTATDDVESIIKKFATSMTGTITMTYKANYKVDIDANGGTANLDSFKRDIESTTTADIDLTSGSYYIKVTNTTVDKKKNTTAKEEGLLYKGEDGKYYAMTTKSTAAEVVADKDVYTTLNSILSEVSNTQVGGVDANTFLYKTDKSYELEQFALTDTFTADDLEDPTLSKNDKGGVKSEYNPTYVGYQTDNGISDFKNHKDSTKAAATIVLNTDSNGYVTDYTETYTDTGLDMPIMSPAPTVLISGSRTFTATYGGNLNKVSTIDHNTDTAYINVTRDTSVISVSGKEFVLNGQVPGAMTDIEFTNNSGSIKVGENKWVALTPKMSTGYEVDSVTVNGKAATLISGMYCFKAEEAGTYDVVVKGKKAGDATVSYVSLGQPTKGEHVASLTINYIVAPNYSDVKEFTDYKAEFQSGMFIAIKATFDDGYTYDSVKVNDTAVTLYQGGYYCYSVKEAGTYTVSVTAKANA